MYALYRSSELTEWMRGYYGMVANLDDNIGRLMNKIKELGLDKNSIIVFTSDHGECHIRPSCLRPVPCLPFHRKIYHINRHGDQ